MLIHTVFLYKQINATMYLILISFQSLKLKNCQEEITTLEEKLKNAEGEKLKS